MVKIKSWLAAHPLSLASASTTAILLFVNISSAQAAAAAIPAATVTDEASLTTLFCNIITFFFWTVLVISVLMVLVSAFDYVTAGEDVEKTTRARRRITYAAVGIAVALLATGFPAIVSTLFPGSPGIGAACSSL